MADVPDQTVAGRVEQVMYGDRKLDDAQPGTQMAACYRYRVDKLVAQFIGQLRKLIGIEPAKVLRRFDSIQERGAVADRHFDFFLRCSQAIAYGALSYYNDKMPDFAAT